MHRSKLAEIGFSNVNVQRLALVDESASIGGHFNNDPLRDFPNGLVQPLHFSRYGRNVLNRAIVRDYCVLHLLIPQTRFGQVSQQMVIDNLNLGISY